MAGYPEKLESKELEEMERTSKESGDQPRETHDGKKIEQVGANSAVIYGPDGAWVGGYRKTNLFETDLTWAKPGTPTSLSSISRHTDISPSRLGTGFATFVLPSPIQTMSLGICMDLNPQIEEWTSATGPYELADYAKFKNANVLVLLNAWLDSKQEVDESSDWQTLNYWAARTRPLWTDGKGDQVDVPETDPEKQGPETVVVVCNRSGGESGMIPIFHTIHHLHLSFSSTV